MNIAFTVLLSIAMLSFVAGFALTWFINVKTAAKTPGFWRAQFGSLTERFAMRTEVGQRARRAENETALGRLANRLLQIGTALGILAAIAFGFLRLFGVPIHVL